MTTQRGSSVFVMAFDSSDERMEIEQWLNQNIQSSSYVLSNFFLAFYNDIDAMAFKLRWS